MQDLRSWSVASRFCPHKGYPSRLRYQSMNCNGDRMNVEFAQESFFWGCLNVGGSLIWCQFPVWEPETSYLFMIFIKVLNFSTHLWLAGRGVRCTYSTMRSISFQTQITCFTWNWMGDTPWATEKAMGTSTSCTWCLYQRTIPLRHFGTMSVLEGTHTS